MIIKLNKNKLVDRVEIQGIILNQNNLNVSKRKFVVLILIELS